MNVGSLKTLSYLTSFGLLGGIGYIGYDYYENGQDVSYFSLDRASDVLNGVKRAEPPKRAALNYATDISPSIVDFDWTGKPPVIEASDDGPGTEDLASVTIRVSEVLEVRGVITDPEDPGDSYCLVGFKDPAVDPDEVWLVVGDTLPAPNESVSLLRILRDGAEFSFAEDGRESETVKVSYRVVDVIVSVADASLIKSRSLIGANGGDRHASLAAPGQTQLRNGQFYIGTEDAGLLQNNFGEILSRDVTTETYYDKDGKRAGIKITDVRAGSIAARHGAQSGDVIISINGTSVHSQQEAIQFAKSNSDRYSVWEVQVMNLGRIRTEIYHSPDN